MSPEQELFIEADTSLQKVVEKILPDQWDLIIPDWFQVGGVRGDLTLKDLINYHAYDEAWVPHVLAGETMAQVGEKYAGDLLGSSPVQNYAKYVELGLQSVRGLDNLDKTVHVSYGDFPAFEYLKHVSSFRGLRVYDISKLTGQDTVMSKKLVSMLWDMLVPEIDSWREMGVFPEPIEIPDTAPLQERLLAMTGRRS